MATGRDPEAVRPKPIRQAWRLKFRFDASGRVELVGREWVATIAPTSPGPPPRSGQNSGAWLEVRDGDDRLLAHRVLHDPFALRASHHSPDGKIELYERDVEPGEFEALVPAFAEAKSVVLFSSPPERGRALDQAQERGQFELPPRPDQRDQGQGEDATGGAP